MLSKVIFRSLSGKYFLDLVLSAVVLQDDQDSCISRIHFLIPKFQKFLYFRRNSTFSPSEKDLCCKISITDLTCFQLIRKFQHRSRQDRDPHSPFRHRNRGPRILTGKIDIADKSRLLKLRGDIFLKPVGQDQGLFRELLQMERCASF